MRGWIYSCRIAELWASSFSLFKLVPCKPLNRTAKIIPAVKEVFTPQTCQWSVKQIVPPKTHAIGCFESPTKTQIISTFLDNNIFYKIISIKIIHILPFAFLFNSANITAYCKLEINIPFLFSNYNEKL